MPRVRRHAPKDQSRAGRSSAVQQSMPLDDGTLATPTTVAMIQARIPLGLRAEEASLAEVDALAGPRYARDDAHPDIGRRASRSARSTSPIRSSRSPYPTCAISAPGARSRSRPTHSSSSRARRILVSSGACWAASRVTSTKRPLKPCPRRSVDQVQRVAPLHPRERARAAPAPGATAR